MFRTLISVTDLAAHRSFVVVDCRHGLLDVEAGSRAYHQGHIAGACFMHIDRDLSGPMTGRNGRHPLPDPQLLAAKLGAIGADAASQLVAYDQNSGMWASRLWWLTRWLGHESVAVLDGGLDAWRAAGQALTTAIPSPAPAHFAIRPSLETILGADELAAHLNDGQLAIIDARAADRFRGENETIDPVAGHIPGALNRPFALNIGSDGRFKPAAQLNDEFRALLGTSPPAQVVHQCGSGVSACHNLLAMEIAGLHGAKLYPGSWSEWIADPARPIARGG
jgi:thiosulfate/3-mercaptopyruvate sulfurtransferase